MTSLPLLLGLDIGSSAVKGVLCDLSGNVISSATSPATEMVISAPYPGWAERPPELWWKHVCEVITQIRLAAGGTLEQVAAIGISYQMHGLVTLNKGGGVIRPAIIWCDSRAVDVGNRAFVELGEKYCLTNLLNSPGNFTASKLAWVKKHEPNLYDQIYKVCLPGDYIAYKLSGTLGTTCSGLSEAILWDFKSDSLAESVLNYFDIDRELLPPISTSFGRNGVISNEAAKLFGFKEGTPISYRAGDQPNNALSLNVLEPGEIAATAGTSGVIYGVAEKISPDDKSRVNVFLHVNHASSKPRYGILACINGAGSLNRWLRNSCFEGVNDLSYAALDKLSASAPIGADGLICLPYGNGAERTLENRNIGSSFISLDLNRHNRSHMIRAAHEGIACALTYGIEIMREMGVAPTTIKAGAENMFRSPVFVESIAALNGVEVILYDSNGAWGAAIGGGIGAGLFGQRSEAFEGLKVRAKYLPPSDSRPYQKLYRRWRDTLEMFS